MPSPPLSKFSASIVPGRLIGVPVYGVVVDGGGAGVFAAAFIYRKFIQPVSNVRVITWRPAPSVTGTVTVDQFCQPPVDGTATVADTALEPAKPTRIDAPVALATRNCRL